MAARRHKVAQQPLRKKAQSQVRKQKLGFDEMHLRRTVCGTQRYSLVYFTTEEWWRVAPREVDALRGAGFEWPGSSDVARL